VPFPYTFFFGRSFPSKHPPAAAVPALAMVPPNRQLVDEGEEVSSPFLTGGAVGVEVALGYKSLFSPGRTLWGFIRR